MRKTIVVVGASKGIGAELVTLFANNPNHNVVALARYIERENRWRDLENVSVHNFDLLSTTIKEDLHAIFTNYSSIDFLVNNAGILVNKPFLELSKNDINSSFQVNVLGVMESLQFFIPKMLQTGGHIVNISSMGAFQGSVKFAGLSTYSSSKAALANITEMLAEEFKNTKLKINCLCLGAVQTEMLANAFPGYEAPVNAIQMANFITDFTINKWQWMNGKIIPVSLSTP